MKNKKALLHKTNKRDGVNSLSVCAFSFFYCSSLWFHLQRALFFIVNVNFIVENHFTKVWRMDYLQFTFWPKRRRRLLFKFIEFYHLCFFVSRLRATMWLRRQTDRGAVDVFIVVANDSFHSSKLKQNRNEANGDEKRTFVRFHGWKFRRQKYLNLINCLKFA